MIILFCLVGREAGAWTWTGLSASNRNWSVAENWLGVTAPSNPTPDAISFEAAGSAGGNVVDQPWTVGGVDVGEVAQAVVHETFFDGNMLSVTGACRVGSSIASGSARWILADGLVLSHTVSVGSANATGWLELSGALMEIAGGLTVGSRGDVVVHIVDEPSGLALDADASLTVTGWGLIDLRFERYSGSGYVWGIRWEDPPDGDHVTELQQLFGEGRIQCSVMPPGYDTSYIRIFSQDGYTYLALYPVLADGTWDGGGANPYWTTAANWQNDVLPATPYAFAVQFAAQGSPGVNLMNQNWTVAALKAGSDGLNATHATDLSGNRLTVNGDVAVAQQKSGNALLTFSNGALQIGSGGTARVLTIAESGPPGWSEGTLSVGTPGASAIFDANLDTVILGSGGGHKGILDLRYADLPGGRFETRILRMGVGGHGDFARYNNELRFGASLTNLTVRQELTLGSGTKTSAFIGQSLGYGSTPLPDGANIALGVNVSNRATVVCGWGKTFDGRGHLGGGAGGTLIAYIDDLTLGRQEDDRFPGSFVSTGVLDFRNMATCVVDVSGACTVGQGARPDRRGQGYLYLPAGTARFNILQLGTFSGWGTGRVECYGTTVRVNDLLSIQNTGRMVIHVGASSCGLDLPKAATFSMYEGAAIDLRFKTTPPSERVWGLRWENPSGAGDRVATLTAMHANGQLTWSLSADATAPGVVEIYSENGFSYVGIAPLDGAVLLIR